MGAASPPGTIPEPSHCTGTTAKGRTAMTTASDRLMQWLRDAHAMELQAEQMLSGMAGRIKNYPMLKSRIEEHIEETKNQARMVERCIQARGGDVSKMKDTAAQILAFAQAASGIFMGDEVMKGALAGYTFEHMEIASYRILIAAAEALGDQQTAMTCRQILAEEEAMAEWLADNVGPLTKEFLDRQENQYAEAKR
jgi:ferritin-like metal-binding protein YciE